jgi:ribose-phosphate pyrophosphokinase
VATHGVLSGPAVDRIRDSCLKSVVITDTVPVPPEKTLPNMTVLSVAPLLADAIDCIHHDRSVSARLQQNNVRQSRLL